MPIPRIRTVLTQLEPQTSQIHEHGTTGKTGSYDLSNL